MMFAKAFLVRNRKSVPKIRREEKLIERNLEDGGYTASVRWVSLFLQQSWLKQQATQPAGQPAPMVAAELPATPLLCNPLAAHLENYKATLLFRAKKGAKPSFLLRDGLLCSGFRFG